MNSRYFMTAVCAAFLMVSCGIPSPEVTVTDFGTLSSGKDTRLYTLVNSQGASLVVTDYGARIVSINVPDRDGNLGDVIVGTGTLDGFENGDRFAGCVIGRYGNRINHASFSIDGIKYEIEANETLGGEPVHCSGGFNGLDRQVWDGEVIREEGRNGIRMHYLSPDGECGYPGNLDCYVTYWWTDDNVCKVEYEAVTDAPTVVNLSNHAYFNLKGNEGGYVMDHQLTVDSDTYVQNNRQLCPDLLLSVEDSPFDFRTPHRVDYRLDMPNEHLRIMKGMSACWVLNGWDGTLRKAADLYERKSGRGVETWTTEPALLTYTGRGFNENPGKYGPIGKYGGMLLETIHFADSPNQDRFPSTILRPGEKYYSTTEWRFYAR